MIGGKGRRIMKENRLQKITIIRITYSAIIAMFIVLAFLPYFSETFTYGPHTYTKNFPGYIELIFGGWVGQGKLI